MSNETTGGTMGSSSRHQLVVLTVFSGANFPPPSSSTSSSVSEVTIRGQLSDVVLVTDPVALKSTSVQFGEQQLVWEVTQGQLRQFRSRKILLRVEVYIDKELSGHLVMDLRTAKPLISPDDLPDAKTHSVVGSQMTLDLALSLEEAETISVNISEDDDDTDVVTVTHSEFIDPLNPTLIEESNDGDGYFLIGPKADASEKFSLGFSLIGAQNLHLAVDPNTVYQDEYYWQYNLLGIDISSEQFPSITFNDGSFVSETATATIKTNQQVLTQYLARSSINVKLCSGAVVIAAGDLPLSCLTLDPAGQLQQVSTSVQLVSGHNMAVVEDKEGNKPTLRLTLSLAKQVEDEITSGRLSDSDDVDMETDGNDGIYKTADDHDGKAVISPPSSPTKVSRKDEVSHSSTGNSPKKLKMTPQTFSPKVIKNNQPKSLDTTEYLTIPSPGKNSSTIAPPSNISSETTPSVAKHYKLSIDLVSVNIVKKDFSGQVGVLAYKYLALHKDPIQSDKFTIQCNNSLPVPKGFCQFSFCVQPEKMVSTFQHHQMKIGLYVNDQMVGISSVNLLNVVKSNNWSDRVKIVEKQDGDLIGFLDVELILEEDNGSPMKKEQEHNLNLAATKDLLHQAAKELEIWKMDQKKKFNENLLQIEQQHLNLLGKEWKEREMEREGIVQEKLAVMKGLEEELRKELEKIEAERREVEEKKKTLQIEKDNVETEKRNVKNEKLMIVDKLKQQIRDKDVQLSVKDSEIELLSKKVKLLESESKRPFMRPIKSASSDKSSKNEELMNELAQLRSEKVSWQSSLEHAEKEAAWLKDKCQDLKLEVANLQEQKEKFYSQQIAGLEQQVRQMSRDKPERDDDGFLEKRGVDVGIQTHKVVSKKDLLEGEDDVDDFDMETVTMSGLLRLEEHSAMLLRTGVYTKDDPIVVKLNEQIRKLRRKIEAVKDN